MAKLSTAKKAAIQSAIDLLVNGTAYETPISQDVYQRLAPLYSDLTYLGKSTNDFVLDNPVTALIGLVWIVGAEAGTLTNAQADLFMDPMLLMAAGTAREMPFSEDVIQRLATAAVSTGFLTAGGFYEAIKNAPVSTMLKWALKLGA